MVKKTQRQASGYDLRKDFDGSVESFEIAGGKLAARIIYVLTGEDVTKKKCPQRREPDEYRDPDDFGIPPHIMGSDERYM